MIYPGDLHCFVLRLSEPDGSDPNVTLAPAVTVVNAVTDVALAGVVAVPMTLITGSQKTYVYVWDTTGVAEGQYLALVDYAVDSVTFQGQSLELVRLGDSRILGEVAREATTAKEVTVAKDETVMKAANFVHPDDADSIVFIRAKVADLPDEVAGAEDVLAIKTLVTDLSDHSFGNWIIDKTTNILTLYRVNGTQLAQFRLTSTNTVSKRERV